MAFGQIDCASIHTPSKTAVFLASWRRWAAIISSIDVKLIVSMRISLGDLVHQAMGTALDMLELLPSSASSGPVNVEYVVWFEALGMADVITV
jgi:hypothetical protein